MESANYPITAGTGGRHAHSVSPAWSAFGDGGFARGRVVNPSQFVVLGAVLFVGGVICARLEEIFDLVKGRAATSRQSDVAFNYGLLFAGLVIAMIGFARIVTG